MKDCKPIRGKKAAWLLALMVIIVAASGPFAAQAATYQYDDMNRLTRVDYGNGNIIQYTYDVAGNRLSEVITGTAVPDTLAILAVSPTSNQVPADESTLNLAVSNTGGGTLTWSASITAGSNWLTIMTGSSGINAGTIQLMALANPDSTVRTATIRIEAPGADNGLIYVSVQQEGADLVSGVNDLAAADRFMVKQNAPNPFNPMTTIEFAVPEAATVHLKVFDLHGRLVRTLIGGRSYGAGWHQAVWNGSNDAGLQVATGVYFYRFTAGEFGETRRMLLIK